MSEINYQEGHEKVGQAKTSGMAISLREKRRYRLSGEAVGW